jgi:hypothetical protein
MASSAADLPIEGKTVKALTLLSVKRSYDLFSGNHGQPGNFDENRCGNKQTSANRDLSTLLGLTQHMSAANG